MARVIFVATVLVALCYTSQALPLSLEDILRDKMREGHDRLIKEWDNIKDQFPKEIKDKMEEAHDILKEKWNRNAGGPAETYSIRRAVGGALGGSKKIIEKSINMVGEVMKEILTTPQEIFDGITKGSKKIEKELTDTDTPTPEAQVAGIIDEAMNDVGKKLNEALDQFNDAMEQVEDALNNAWNEAMEKGQKQREDTKGMIEDGIKDVNDKINETKNKLKDWVNRL